VDLGDRPLTAAAGPATAAQGLVAVAMVAMVAVTMSLGLTSDHLQRPLAATLYWSYLTAAPMLIGLYWCRRRSASRFGPLLVAMGVLGWMTSWQAANAPLAFDLGVLAEGPFFLLTFYLFLAFPMGRIEPRAARWLMGALVLGVLAFFLPWALFTPVIAGGGPLTGCAPGCPQNVLQIATAPGVVEVAGTAETYAALAITAAVFVVYLARLRNASQPQRRALMAVAVTSLLFLPAYFVHSFAASILKLDQATLDALAWGVVGARILLPLGFLIALLQAELFAGRALRMLFERVAARPTPEQWRDTIAEALDDSALRLGYHDPATERFREPDGDELARPTAGAGRAWVAVDREGGEPVAAMVVDEALTADPELVRAASAATLVAVENGALEGELRDSRARILEAGNAARRRIERDLHDSAQQRLIALRIGLTLAGDQVAGPRERAMIDRLGLEVDETIDELRDVAHGVYPQVLEQRGLAAALRAVARRSVLPVSVRDEGLARHSEALETSIYFSCVECLQNAAKHAGPGASVTIRLAQENGHVSFSVEDDGAGFDPAVVGRGRGLTNIADRVAAVGGTVAVDARPGRGTRVSATLPASPQ
jgi:signal transduction histidine kinase